MQDLNATMFYKAKFTLLGHEKNVDLLWNLICEIRSWLTMKHNRDGHIIVNPKLYKWTRFKKGGKLFDEEGNNLFFAISQYHEDADNPEAVSWACKIEETPEMESGFAPREWVTEIGYQSTMPGTAEISYVITYSDYAGFIGELSPAPGISLPRVIRKLLNNPLCTCKIGNTVLSTEPVKLNPGDFPDFQKTLLDEDREIPIVYVSPKRVDLGSDMSTLSVSPQKLAECIAANGLVYYSDDLDFSKEMLYLGDERYNCTGGAVRLYCPGINLNEPSDQYRHRIISAKYIADTGEDKVLEIFRRALAQDVHYYDTMFRLESCQALIENDKRQKRLKAIKEKSDADVSEAYSEYLTESDRRALAEKELEETKGEVNRLKTEIFNRGLQIEALQEKANQSSSMENSCMRIRSISEYPSSPVQIAQYFEMVFPDRIAFTERAYRSLEDCITRADFLWNALYCISTTLYELLHEKPSQAYKEFTNQTGWECSRGNGHQTRADSKLMRQYVDTYNGQEINIEAHIKNGNNDKDPKSVRIYFAYDSSVADKIIIGHCGKHLDNATTRKVK